MTPTPLSDYVSSWYAATAPLAPAGPALQGDARADVCVIGAGIAGCSAALSLAERGYRVAVLEGRRIGWGASGRSGGQVIYGLASEQDEVSSLVGAADARRIWDMSLEAIEQLKRRVAHQAIDCDWVNGQMLTAIKVRQWRALQDWHAELTGPLGYGSARLIENNELRSLLGSQRYIGALYDTNGGHLHPLRYTLGLARAAAAAGAQFYENSAMLDWTPTRAGVRLRT